MSEDSDAEAGSLLGATRTWLSRKLAPGLQTLVQGGGNTDTDHFDRHRRSRERLKEYEEMYQRGGPVASLVDTRALMTFGTGVNFISDDEQEISTLVDGEVVTVTEWLEDNFDGLDNLLVQLGINCYVYGDGLGDIVETVGGGFKKVGLVNPKTMDPFWDDQGRIHRWEQTITKPNGDEKRRSFSAKEIPHIKLHTLAREPTGISLLGQNYDEVRRFARNQEAIENAMRLHGFPKYHIKVGREGAGAVSDTDLRRVRSRFSSFNEKTNFTTGRDIEIETLDTAGFDVDGLSEHDLMILAAGFGVPEEMAGLGRGSTEATAKVRLQAFERAARAEQRSMADQFIEQVVRPVLDRYSPFPPDVDIGLEFGDVVSDQTATAEWLRDFSDYYTVDEVREKLGDGPAPEDEELGPPEGAGDDNPLADMFGGGQGGFDG